MMTDSIVKAANIAATNMFKRKPLWLAVRVKRRSLVAFAEDCILCSGLLGGVLFPSLVSVDRETLEKFIEEHDHYMFVDVEVFRCEAHMYSADGTLHIVPNTNTQFIAPEDGSYDIAIYNELETPLFTVDIGFMRIGAEFSTLELTLELCGV